jgi:hypothetical protein
VRVRREVMQYMVGWVCVDGAGSTGPFTSLEEARREADRLQAEANRPTEYGVNPWRYRYRVYELRLGGRVVHWARPAD